MRMNDDHIAYLWRQYIAEKATPGELRELFDYIQKAENDDINIELFREQLEKYGEQNVFSASQDIIWQKLASLSRAADTNGNEHRVTLQPVSRLHFLRRWGWAAAVLLVAGISAYLWSGNKTKINTPAAAVAKADHRINTTEIPPGKEGAVLTLADGSQVVLDSLGNGLVATQGGTRILLKDGRLAYDPAKKADGGTIYQNTITTPKGRQFQIVLPDGTRAWLNSVSSIRYPVVFAGNERKVEVTGEVYFEVAKNAKMPFLVNVDDRAEIEVLGTNFNVNAYENESSLNTTLLEGNVRVNGALIRPGQQAVIPVAGSSFSGKSSENPLQVRVMDNVDIDKVIAWKNGFFNFNGQGLKEIMRQIERWYDIKVEYTGVIHDTRYYGELNKSTSLDGILQVLQTYGIKYKREGNILYVLGSS